MRTVAGIFSVLLVIGGILSKQPLRQSPDYVYSEDKQILLSVQDLFIRDSVVIYPAGLNRQEPLYDCILAMPDDAHLYVVDDAGVVENSFPDTVLIWAMRGQNIEPYLANFNTAGFWTIPFGNTHTSDRYIAQRN